MVERITISFDMDKENLLNMFKEDSISKALEKFLQTYFSSYMQIHVRSIRHNMKCINEEIEEEKLQQIVFEHLKSCIKQQDMEMLQIEAAKAFLKESFANANQPTIAIYKAFEAMEVIAIAENIQKKLRYQFLLAAV